MAEAEAATRAAAVSADVDAAFMRRALRLAAQAVGSASPNPLVGCVLVRDGVIVGEGYHQRAGGPHAEVLALEAAGVRARGATAYVTLEPCNHTGRTGPCTLALSAAGVARVVAAMPDPNPVAMGGRQRLEAAGVRVDVGVCLDEALRLNEVFVHTVTTGRPFVTVKAAVSLDGRIAAADATSKWLTGEAARLRAHRLRAAADAVVVGSGTVLADDPHLTCRLPGYTGRQPRRVVLDRRGRVTTGYRVLDDVAPTWVVRDHDLPGLLDALWTDDARSVLVEGGAGVSGAFLRAGLWDKLVLHVAPLLLGERGQPLLTGAWPDTLADVERYVLRDVEQVGPDAVLTLYRGA